MSTGEKFPLAWRSRPFFGKIGSSGTKSPYHEVPRSEIMNAFIDKIISIPVPFNMIIIMMAIIFGAGIITSVAKQIRKYLCLREELEFKREMIDRGMTPDEIERLVKCKSPSQLSDTS